LLLCKAGIVMEARDAGARRHAAAAETPKACGREATNNADPGILEKVQSTD
jgi:hypothetical protein